MGQLPGLQVAPWGSQSLSLNVCCPMAAPLLRGTTLLCPPPCHTHQAPPASWSREEPLEMGEQSCSGAGPT